MILVHGAHGTDPVSFGATGFSRGLLDQLTASCPAGARIGLIAETGAALFEAWHACLKAGYVPVMLQQPSAKLSRLYWSGEIANTVVAMGIGGLICQSPDECPDTELPTILMNELPPPGAAPGDKIMSRMQAPAAAQLMQLSSGTTGHRKGVGFSFGDIAAHIGDYNQVLGLSPDDCIVSWLPLYHDMGFIAAFLASQIIGCRLVVIDPLRWVRQPELLFDLIEQHGGTICFLPNFAFELMARRGRPRALATMRRWISCSEPTRFETMARFMDAMSIGPEKLANCYGMAENVFAVTQSNQLATCEIDGRTLVSCGPPIPNTEVKIVDGEICIRSPYSLRHYVDGPDIVDEDGFYPSGDMGFFDGGNLYISGRRRDLINVAGVKYMLSDIDRQLDTEHTGRIASFGVVDPLLGTETAVGLVEDELFWRRNRDAESRAALSKQTGIETLQVHFVPPRFITKTSSGKVNRVKTAQHWTRHIEERRLAENGEFLSRDALAQEIRETFPTLKFEEPIGDQLDSLGLVNLSLLLSKTDVNFYLDPRNSVSSYIGAAPSADTGALVINVVSLCDYEILGLILKPVFEAICEGFDVPIQIRHVAAPPSKVLLSDLKFVDYFMSRDDRFGSREEWLKAYSAVVAQQRLIRNASVILVDDLTEFYWPTDGVGYPMLSHDFESGQGSDCLAVRWQRYVEHHHQLKYRVLTGTDLPPEDVNRSLAEFSDYLNIPVIRIAFDAAYEDHTSDWDVQCLKPFDRRYGHAMQYADNALWVPFALQLQAALSRTVGPAGLRPGEARSFVEASDIEHWCAWQVNPALLDFILDRYDNILVLGYPASATYMQTEAARRGKRVTYRPSLDAGGDFDCVVQLGSWGRPITDKPLFVVMADRWTNVIAHNVPDAIRQACPRREYVENGCPTVLRVDSLQFQRK